MDLVNSAIVIIYEDGCIESIPIEGGKYDHCLYYGQLNENSEKFRSICGNCNFLLGIHYHIDKILVEHNAIVLQNWNVKEISLCKENGRSYYDLPSFVIFLPHQFGSIKQINNYEKMLDGYPLINLIYYKYINQELGFTENYSNEDLQNEIQEFKNENIERRN